LLSNELVAKYRELKMEVKPAEITICMGSSCFSRGNKKALPAIQEYLKGRGLEGHVVFKGSHCFGKCELGPVLHINGVEYRQVNPGQLPAILDHALFPDQT
jgi:NADH:ubiquinone oxidoreductase subunit E